MEKPTKENTPSKLSSIEELEKELLKYKDNDEYLWLYVWHLINNHWRDGYASACCYYE